MLKPSTTPEAEAVVDRGRGGGGPRAGSRAVLGLAELLLPGLAAIVAEAGHDLDAEGGLMSFTTGRTIQYMHRGCVARKRFSTQT